MEESGCKARRRRNHIKQNRFGRSFEFKLRFLRMSVILMALLDLQDPACASLEVSLSDPHTQTNHGVDNGCCRILHVQIGLGDNFFLGLNSLRRECFQGAWICTGTQASSGAETSSRREVFWRFKRLGIFSSAKTSRGRLSLWCLIGWGKGFLAVPAELAALRDTAAESLIHFHAHVFVDPANVEGSTPGWKAFYDCIADTFKDDKCVCFPHTARPCAQCNVPALHAHSCQA
jgi:hypothetical protein